MIVIVPFRNSGEGRLEAAKHVLMHLRELGVDVAVIERGTTPSDLGCKGVAHQFFPDRTNHEPFRKSELLNIAVRFFAPSEKHLAFCDADMWIDQDLWEAAFRTYTFASADVVSPYNQFVWVTKEETQTFYDAAELPPRSATAHRALGRGSEWLLTGGACIMSRAAWEAVGGWDENFAYWGSEDNAMSLKLRKLGLKCIENVGTAHHLWHHQEEKTGLVKERWDVNAHRAHAISQMSRAELEAYIAANDFTKGKGTR